MRIKEQEEKPQYTCWLETFSPDQVLLMVQWGSLEPQVIAYLNDRGLELISVNERDLGAAFTSSLTNPMDEKEYYFVRVAR